MTTSEILVERFKAIMDDDKIEKFLKLEERNLYWRSHLLVQRVSDGKFAVIPARWVESTCRWNDEDKEIFIPVDHVSGLRLDGSEVEWVTIREDAVG